MLDQPQRWATMTNFAKFNNNMKEYFITGKTPSHVRKVNAQLRQEALLSKIQSVCSDSSLQNRQQKRFPMDHSREETIRTIQNKQNKRRETLTAVQKARADSKTLRIYSLKMFDDAVFGQKLSVNSNGTQNGHGISKGQATVNSKQTCVPVRPQTACNNGPSHENVLYNRRGKVLNSIRLRPKSEPPVRFNHEKGKVMPAEIQRTLCQSNNDFRVKVTTPSPSSVGVRPSSFCSGSSTVSDFKLVPVSESLSEQSFVPETVTDSSLKLDSSADNVFHENDNALHKNADDTPRSRASSSSDLAFRMRNVITGPVHYYSLEYESSSEGSVKGNPDENKPPPVEEPPPPPPSEEPRPKSGRKGKGAKGKVKPKSPVTKKKDKKGKDQEKAPPTPEVTQAEEAEKPVVKKPLKGPKCWVDDATITSNIDPADQDGVLNDPDLNTDQQTQCAKTLKDKQDTVAQNKNATPVNATDVTQNKENVTGILHLPDKMTEAQLKTDGQDTDVKIYEVQMSLPKYICPSSVRKSKHAAIKDWLTKTDFCHAERSVPLL